MDPERMTQMKSRAFTLIDLLVIIEIIATLATIAILAVIIAPLFMKDSEKAHWSKRMAEIEKGSPVTDQDLARMTPDQRNQYAPKAGMPGSTMDVIKLQVKLDDGMVNEISVEVPKGKHVVSVTALTQAEASPSPTPGSELLSPPGS